MPRTFTQLVNWAEGVNTSAPPDMLPVGASPRGHNTTLRSIGAGAQTSYFVGTAGAVFATRLGAQTRNSTPLSGSPGIIGGFQYRKKSGTKFNLLVSDTGRLDLLNVNDTTTTINATAFTTGVNVPIFAVANDLCFIVNPVNQNKYDGTSFTKFGITRPVAPTAVIAAGGAMAAGLWDVAITYYNSLTGHESSRSDFSTVTTAAGNLSITVSWAAPTDPQVTHVRVYIRQESVGGNAYRTIAGATPAADVTTGGFPVATLSTLLNITALQYSAFTLIAPSTIENEPPLAGALYPCWHNSRMFLADSGNIYYSDIKNNAPFPEAFPPTNFEPVNPNDGDTIVGLASAWGTLFIFKRFSLWSLVGTDPGSWTVSLVSRDCGLSSMQSIVTAEGALFWWGNTYGPMIMANGTLPVSLGRQLIAGTIDASVLAVTNLSSTVGVCDEANQTIMWAVPELGQTRNTRIIPFNYKLNRFVADLWNPFDTYSMWPVETADHLKAVYMGNYAGQAFTWAVGTNDGVPAATTTHGQVTSSGNTTLTDSLAAFATTGAGLIERMVYAISSDRITVQRRRITANTATQLTVNAAWDTNPNTTYSYVVGGIDFQLDTPWNSDGSAFIKKRFEFMLMELNTISAGVAIDVDFFTSRDDVAPLRTKTFSPGASGGVYDAATSIYDITTYATSTTSYAKLRVALVGKSWKVRLRQLKADADFSLYKLAMQSVPLSIKD